MLTPKFYSKQYAAMISTVDRAITFIEKENYDAAKFLLVVALSAAEEAYIQACEEEEDS